MEKRLEVQGSMALGFIDLEKAFDTVPREMVMATLRWMGVPEAEVRTVEGMYEKTMRQMVEKRLEVQGSMALGFIDLEKAFDTVPREMVMATLRWMGVPEAEVRTVEGMYEKTIARVVVEGASEEFEVKIGLRTSRWRG